MRRELNNATRLPRWLTIKLSTCECCALHKTRRQVVIGKGSVPADVLFLGEAPGKTEDLFGYPFVGPSGRLLDDMLLDSVELIRRERHADWKMPSYFIANTVMCHPTDEKYGENRAPKPEEVVSCADNLQRVVRLVKPRLVLFLGRVAEKYYKKEFPHNAYIRHPSFLLRQGGRGCDAYGPAVRDLSEALLTL